MKDIIILGAGLSGISTAYFLQNKSWVKSITLLEKEDSIGGLCRSIQCGKYTYDIGPHILFSKDKEMLDLMLSVLEEKNNLKRSNQIYYKGRQIQYPFENDLSKLPPEDLAKCIQTFNHNPYENYNATNMIQFFLKTFGGGITDTYLRPYNEKIWKYDPAFMNTAMVDRIPKPTPEEIRRSAAGETVEGYLHQLYFHYPSSGGIQSVVNGFEQKIDPKKCKIITGVNIKSIQKSKDKYNESFFEVHSNHGSHASHLLISTIPVQYLTSYYGNKTETLQQQVNDLRYNSIAIAFVKTPYDLCGENYCFTIPDKDVIFHRISKMDFLGDAYHHSDGEATYMVEVTFRANDATISLGETEIQDRIKQGLCDIEFAYKKEDIEVVNFTTHEFAYVIYDLNHASNMSNIRQFYQDEKILLNGRFGNFEYWNMDRILRESMELSERVDGG